MNSEFRIFFFFLITSNKIGQNFRKINFKKIKFLMINIYIYIKCKIDCVYNDLCV